MYNRSYGEWQDSVNNAYNSANLQLNEHGQLYDQLYNTYQAVQDNANTKYAQEYQGWADEINNAFNIAQMANSDYWSSAELAQRQAEHNADIAYKYKALQQDNEQYYAKMLSDKEQADAKAKAEAGKLTAPNNTQLEDALRIRNEQGIEAYDNYLLQLEAMGVDTQPVTMHVEGNRDVSWLETFGVNASDALRYLGTNAKDVWQDLWR
jgi:hypothetical protein